MSAKSETRTRVAVGTLGELRRAINSPDLPDDMPVIVDPDDAAAVISECWDISVGEFIRITARAEAVPA